MTHGITGHRNNQQNRKLSQYTRDRYSKMKSKVLSHDSSIKQSENIADPDPANLAKLKNQRTEYFRQQKRLKIIKTAAIAVLITASVLLILFWKV